MSELPIAEPCDEAWDAMERSPGARRFCDRCTKHVHDLSELSEPEARAVLATAATDRICVRYRVDGSGALKFRANDAAPATDLVTLSRRPRTTTAPRPRHSGLVAGSTAVFAAALAACTPHHDGDDTRPAIEVDGNAANANEAMDRMGRLGVEPMVDERVLMGEPMPVEPDDAGQEAPCDPDPTPNAPTQGETHGEAQEVELMGDVAVEPGPTPAVEPAPAPVPKPEQVVLGRVGVQAPSSVAGG